MDIEFLLQFIKVTYKLNKQSSYNVTESNVIKILPYRPPLPDTGVTTSAAIWRGSEGDINRRETMER